MKTKVKEKQKPKIIYSILFILVVIIFVVLLILTIPSKKIKEINSFIKGDTKILYIIKDNNYKYSVDILEKYDMKNSARNVLAAARLLNNPSNVFDTLFNTEGKSSDYQEMIDDRIEKLQKMIEEARAEKLEVSGEVH